MGPPGVRPNLRGLVGSCGSNQSVPQPCCLALPELERFAKYTSLVPAARVRRTQAIVLDLADIENRPIAVRQTCRHTGARPPHLMRPSEYINGWYSDGPAPSTVDPF